MMSDELDVYPLFVFILPAAVLSLFVGVPVAIWQMRKRREQGQTVLWEGIGLLLCLLPLASGCCLLFAVEEVKTFNSIAQRSGGLPSRRNPTRTESIMRAEFAGVPVRYQAGAKNSV